MQTKRRGPTILSLAVLLAFCLLSAACGSSSGNKTADDTVNTNQDVQEDVDTSQCNNDVELDLEVEDDVDAINNCGGVSTGGLTACTNAQPQNKATFTLIHKLPDTTATTECKLKTDFTGTELDSQISRETMTQGGITIILLRSWNKSSRNSVTTETLAPVYAAPATATTPGTANFLCLFPLYAEQMLTCLTAADPTDCLAKAQVPFQDTGATITVDGKKCRQFTIAGSPIKVCIPLDCALRSTLSPLQIEHEGTKSIWSGLKTASFPDSDLKP